MNNHENDILWTLCMVMISYFINILYIETYDIISCVEILYLPLIIGLLNNVKSIKVLKLLIYCTFWKGTIMLKLCLLDYSSDFMVCNVIHNALIWSCCVMCYFDIRIIKYLKRYVFKN